MDVMRHQPFAIFTDGSNDNGLEKMMPLSINVLGDSGVKSEFLDICMCRSSTAEGRWGSSRCSGWLLGISVFNF